MKPFISVVVLLALMVISFNFMVDRYQAAVVLHDTSDHYRDEKVFFAVFDHLKHGVEVGDVSVVFASGELHVLDQALDNPKKFSNMLQPCLGQTRQAKIGDLVGKWKHR